MNESGIGIDFSRGEAAVRRLELMCSSSAGTTQTVVRFSVLISEFQRDKYSVIMNVRALSDNMATFTTA